MLTRAARAALAPPSSWGSGRLLGYNLFHSMLAPLNLFLLFAFIALIICVYVLARYRRSAAFSFYFKVGLLMGFGVVLLLMHVPYLNDDFARALGHALIIAAILAATVDLYVKERVLREVTLDVSKYLVGYRLPEEVQDRIRALMQSKWIRRGCEVRMRFTEAGYGGKKLKADIRISAEMQNITSETLQFRHGIGFEKHEPVTMLELQCDSEDSGSAFHLEGEALKAATADSDGLITCSGKVVNIPPVASIDRSYRFRSHYEVVHPVAFSEIISFDYLTIGVVVEITDAPDNYNFRVTPTPDHVSHHRWEYKRLFVPGEHVRISWSPEGKK
jgi:hypothetical protein